MLGSTLILIPNFSDACDSSKGNKGNTEFDRTSELSSDCLERGDGALNASQGDPSNNDIKNKYMYSLSGSEIIPEF